MTRPAAALLSLPLLLLAPPAAAAPAPAPEPPGIQELVTELRTRYAETAEASAAYNEAGGRLRDLHARAESRDARLARARRELDRARAPAGALARAQYRAGPRLPAGLRLLLGGASPHEEAVARGAERAQVSRIARLARAERRAAREAEEARAELTAERARAEERRRSRDAAHRRLDELAGLLAGLTPEQAAALGELERARAASAPPGG